MARTAVLLKIDGEHVVQTLGAVRGHLERAGKEMELDFSCVRRLDSSAIQAMQAFAEVADQRRVRVVLRNINVDVYKVLTLANLRSRFVFVN